MRKKMDNLEKFLEDNVHSCVDGKGGFIQVGPPRKRG